MPNGSDTDDSEINHNCSLECGKFILVKIVLCITTYHSALISYIQCICTNRWLILIIMIIQNALLHFYPPQKLPHKFRSSFTLELARRRDGRLLSGVCTPELTAQQSSRDPAAVFTSVPLTALPQSSAVCNARSCPSYASSSKLNLLIQVTTEIKINPEDVHVLQA